MPDRQPLSVPAAFFATLWGKILAVLAAITMVIGIYVEIVAAWRGTNEARITSINVEKAVAEARKAAAEAREAEATADAKTLRPTRTTKEIQDQIGEETRLEACRQKGLAPADCPKF